MRGVLAVIVLTCACTAGRSGSANGGAAGQPSGEPAAKDAAAKADPVPSKSPAAGDALALLDPTDPDAKPSAGGSFAALVDAADPESVAAVESLYAAFEAHAGGDKAEVARNWRALSAFLGSALDRLRFAHGEYAEYLMCKHARAGGKDGEAPPCEYDESRMPPGTKEILDKLDGLGFTHEYAGEGTYDLGLDWDAVAKRLQLKARLPADEYAHLAIERWRFGKMLFDDETLAIEEPDLRAGLTLMEDFVAAHPKSRHAQKVTNLLAQHQAVYLEMCLLESPDRPSCKAREDLLAGYRAFVRDRKQSAIHGAVAALVDTAGAGKPLTVKQVRELERAAGIEPSLALQ